MALPLDHPHLSHHSRRVRGQSLSSFKLPRTLATFRVNLKLHDHDSDSDSESESADSRAGDSEPRWAPHPISMWAPPGQLEASVAVTVCLGCPWDPTGVICGYSLRLLIENLTNFGVRPLLLVLLVIPCLLRVRFARRIPPSPPQTVTASSRPGGPDSG